VGTEIEYSLAPMIAADDDCCRLGEGSAETVIGRVERAAARRRGVRRDQREWGGSEPSGWGSAYEKSMAVSR